jgi:hypothetical protein
MDTNSVFWTAFVAGLGAPVGLYTYAAPYAAYNSNYGLPHTFGAIGTYMTRAIGQAPDVRPAISSGT